MINSNLNNLEIQVLNKNQHLSIYVSQKLEKELGLRINDDIQQLFKAIAKDHIHTTRKSIREMDFSFGPGHELTIRVIMHDGTEKVYKGSEVAQHKNISRIEEELFSYIDQIRLKALPSQNKHKHTLIQRFSRFVQQLFLYYFVIKPLVQKSVDEFLKEKGAQELKENYANLFKIIHTELFESNPTCRDLFSLKEIETLIELEMSSKIASQSNKDPKNVLWDNKILQQLKIIKKIEDLIENPHTSHKRTFNFLHKVPPLDIPLNQLKEIPITPENRQQLAELWRHILGSFFNSGNFVKLTPEGNIDGVELRKQSDFAVAYLNALGKIPEDLKDVEIEQEMTLGGFCEKLNYIQSPENLKNFVVENTDRALELDDPQWQNERLIYEQHILPVIEGLELYDNTLEELITRLLFREDGFVENFVVEVQARLSDEDVEIFDQDRIVALLVNEIEKIALSKFHLSAPQLEKIQTMRESVKRAQTSRVEIETQLESVSKEDEAEPSSKEEGIEWFNALLKDDEATINALESVSSKADEYHEKQLDLIVSLWQKIFEHLLSNAQIEGDNDQLSNTLKNQLNRYVRTRAIIQSLPETLKDRLEEITSQIESQYSSQVQTYLDETPVRRETIGEILFNEDFLEQIRVKPEYSNLTPTQQHRLFNFIRLRHIFTESSILTSQEKTRMQELLKELSEDLQFTGFIKSCIEGELDSNQFIIDSAPSFLKKLLSKLLARPSKPESDFTLRCGIKEDHIIFLNNYFSLLNKKKDLAAIHNANAKAEKLVALYQHNPSDIKPEDRLTIQEVGIVLRLHHLVSASNLEANLNDLELLNNNGDPILFELIQAYRRAKAVFDKLTNLIMPEVNQHYPDGCLAAYVGKKKALWNGKPLNLEERLTSFLTNGLLHGAKLFHNNEDQLSISSIQMQYEEKLVSFYHLCISNIWSLDVAPLIHRSLQKPLRRIYGKDWAKVVNQMYQDIEKDLHIRGSKKWLAIRNDGERRLRAGLADYPWLFKSKGHQANEESDFDKIHEQLFEEEELSMPLICSEFASKTTLAAMIELNKQLTKKILRRNVPDFDGSLWGGNHILTELQSKGASIPPDVEKYLQGYKFIKNEQTHTIDTKRRNKAVKDLRRLLNKHQFKDADLIIRLSQEEVLDLPYSRKERMEVIHPGRMIKLLVDKKCVKKLEPPQVFTNLIKI